MSESKMDIRIAHARMRADLMKEHLASGNPLVRVDVEALVNSLREMLGYLGEAGPLPPEPDHFTAGDLVGVANIITDVDTYPSVEACARAVLERAVRDGLVRGVVPAPPPDSEAIEAAALVVGELAVQLGGEAFSFERMPEDNRYWAAKILEAVDRGASAPPAGPWKVTTRRDADGDHWGVDREPEVGVNWYHGGFATESEALAVRDALNRVAGGASTPVPTGESGAAESGVSEAG